MNHRILLLAAVLLPVSALVAEAQDAPLFKEQTLFQQGDNGYACYRIPSLVVTKKGTVLAFAEARKNNCSDHGDVDLVVKRSEDGGRTWSKMRIIADDGSHTMGNPCPVVDRDTGVIWLPYCRTNKQVLLTKSADDGRTWAPSVEITKQAMNPQWHWVGTGPGHGIQLRSGRLVIPCWADAKPRLGEAQLSYAFFSDDHGATWTYGAAADENASDECEVVELADGSLYMNARSRQGKNKRAFTFSKDGGRSWSPIKYDARMPERSCQGSVTRLTDATIFRRGRVLAAFPTDKDKRARMTVFMSYDECRTWPVSKVVNAGSSAYSDLAVTSDPTNNKNKDKNILLAYESDGYAKIRLARFNVQWLSDGKDRLRTRK